MKIQLGVIYQNKTKKYLLPCLKSYGEPFVDKIQNLFKLGIGIGDFSLTEMGIKLEEHIFILVDTNLSRLSFKSTMNWLKLPDYFGFDYAFDDIHLGHLHMIAIKIPEDYKGAYAMFKDSQYSKMYDYEALEQFFKGREEELRILVKDETYQIDFVSIINKEFNTTVDHLSWTGELDFTWKQEEEYFHKSIK